MVAIVSVTVRGAGGCPDSTVNALIDTGYDGDLSLPATTVSALNLPFKENRSTEVVGGGDIDLPIYHAVIVFGGNEIVGEVMAADNPPLIGMALLAGYDLHIEVIAGGNVTLTPRPVP